MKKLILLGSIFIVIGITMTFKEDLFKLYASIFNNYNTIMKIDKSNANNFFLEEDYNFVQIANNFIPKNKQDVINIYYTIINSGLNKFSFTCQNAYDNCIKDVDDISNNQTLLSNINNYVHPYNSFKNIETQFDALKNVSVKISPSYTKNQIKAVDKKINDFISSHINDNQTEQEKIKLFHDHVINNSKYDSDRSNLNIINYASDIAYGNLLEGYGICGGYADSMKIFLDKLGIKNYKVASENHIWNLVFHNEQWLHLDLTWDDPVHPDGKDILDYTFFLITSDELEEQNTGQHIYNKQVFSEAK